MTLRSFHVIQSRSAIGPFTFNRCPSGPVALAIVPRQLKTPAIPIGRNRGPSVAFAVASRHNARVLNSPSVRINGNAALRSKDRIARLVGDTTCSRGPADSNTSASPVIRHSHPLRNRDDRAASRYSRTCVRARRKVRNRNTRVVSSFSHWPKDLALYSQKLELFPQGTLQNRPMGTGRTESVIAASSYRSKEKVRHVLQR